MNHDLKLWMDKMHFSTIDSFQGVMSQQNVTDPSAYERANYIRILEGGKG